MRGVLSIGLAVWLFAAPALAANEGVLRYLSSEPVTLLDWGLTRMKADLGAAATQRVDGFGAGEHRAGAFYNWRRGHIVAYLTLATRHDLRTAENCKTAYRRVVDHLSFGAPSGVGAAIWYVEEAFGHAGGFRRPTNFGEQLVDTISFEVALRASEADHKAGDWMRVSCTGRLNSAAADLETELSGAIQ